MPYIFLVGGHPRGQRSWTSADVCDLELRDDPCMWYVTVPWSRITEVVVCWIDGGVSPSGVFFRGSGLRVSLHPRGPIISPPMRHLIIPIWRGRHLSIVWYFSTTTTASRQSDIFSDWIPGNSIYMPGRLGSGSLEPIHIVMFLCNPIKTIVWPLQGNHLSY